MSSLKNTVFVILLLGSFGVSAAVPNVLGTYSGTNTGNFNSCFLPQDNGIHSNAVNLIIDKQDGSIVSGTDFGPGGGTFTGTLSDNGSFSGKYKAGNGEQGSFTGTISGNVWTANWVISVPGDRGCSGSGSFTATGSGTGALATAQVQQSRQIVRITNSLISQHLATEVSNAFFQMPDKELTDEPKEGASSDNRHLLDAFWGTTSISEIHEDGSNLAHFDTDIYQFVGGIDKRIGNAFLGSAFTYAYSETEQTGSDSNSHVIGITPYAAYQLTDFMFASGLAGYNYSLVTNEHTGDDLEVHDYIFEGNLNFYKIWHQRFITKARFGSRFHHSIITSVGDVDDSSDELVWLGDLELGYRFDNGLITYIGGLYEYRDKEESFQADTEHDGIAYMRGGFDYPVYDGLTLGGKVQADLNDEDRDIITGSLNVRMDF